MPWPYPQTQALMFECLKERMIGQYWDLVYDIINLAIFKKLYPGKVDHNPGADPLKNLQGGERQEVPELIRQLMWTQLVRGLIVFGKDEKNSDWPFYRVTGLGQQVFDGQKTQPYDQNNFLSEFRTENPRVDDVIYDYLDEAVKTFNSGCFKSTAVMLGCASEKAIILLLELFTTKISNAAKKTAFEAAINSSWMISTRFRHLNDRLSLMANGNRFPGNTELKNIVIRTLPGVFDLVRNLRNAVGHPELLVAIREDTMFLSLRLFSEYIKGIYLLIDYFTANPADWP